MSSRRRISAPRSLRLASVSAIVVITGLVYLMVGMAQLLQPEWYFANVAPFEPYHRLNIGVAGSLMWPLGVVLIIASQNPSSSKLVIGMGAAVSVLMVFNQWYAAATGEVSGETGGAVSFALVVIALGMLWAFWQVRPKLRRR